MSLSIRNALSTNSILKCSALFIAFFIWTIVHQSRPTQLTVTAPVCFYNVSDTVTLEASEQVLVTLYGTRQHLRMLSIPDVAIHIDANTLHTGINMIDVEPQQLLLPPYVYIVKQRPLYVLVNYTRKP